MRDVDGSSHGRVDADSYVRDVVGGGDKRGLDGTGCDGRGVEVGVM